MRRRHALPVALLAALAAAAPAEAKQVVGLTACGADGCKGVGTAAGQAMHDVGGTAIAGSPKAGPYFRLVMHIGEGKRTFGTSRVMYVPRSRTLGSDGGWSLVSAATAAKLDRALAGRPALPSSGFEAAAAKLAPPPESRPPEIVLPPEDPATAASEASGGTAWWLLGAGAGALGLVAALGLLLRRRGRLTLAHR